MKPVIPIAYTATQAEIDAGLANNLPKGTSVIIIDVNSQPVDIKVAQGNNTPPADSSGIKNNFAATTAPTTTDDSGDGYSLGSRWIDTTGDESYICVDSTLNNAVWSKTTVGTIAEVANLQTSLDAKAPLASPAFTGTPTGITKTHVGLSNVDNVSDVNKPVSTAQQTALNLKQDASTAATDTELTAHTGSTTNPHSVTKAQVGLGSAENTSDASKPVSTATQTALDGKSATSHAHTGTYEPADATILKEAEVVNTLVGTDTNKPLSAAQGKALQDGKRELYSLGHPYHTAATEAGHIVTASSEFNADYAGWKALQQSPAALNEWATANAPSASLTYQLPQATIFNRVVLMGRISGTEYPTIWSIEGSNDGTTYTTLVASHTESLQAEVTKDFTNTTAYKYYRFSYTAGVGNNLGLNRIRFFHNGINYLPTLPINNTLTSTSTTDALSAAQGKALQDGKQELYEGTVALRTPNNLTSNTSDPNYILTASSEHTIHLFYRVFDGNDANHWYTLGTSVANGVIELNYKIRPTNLLLRGETTILEYWTRWQLQGSKDGTNWDTLVDRSGVDEVIQNTSKNFPITTSKEYKYFRFNGLAAVGTNIPLSRLEISGVEASRPTASVKVTRSTAQSLSSAGTIVSWDTADHEVGATTLWDVANPTRLTAPVAGTYLVVADIAAESDSTGQITILRNGTAVHNGTAPRFWTGSGSTSALVRLSAGDYIECRVTPATTVNSIVAAERHYLAMVFVSP